jgi:hypothetical protein
MGTGMGMGTGIIIGPGIGIITVTVIILGAPTAIIATIIIALTDVTTTADTD